MSRSFVIVVTTMFLYCCSSGIGASDSTSLADLRPGDILFQDLASPQGMAVKLATHSEYTHCGILLESDSQLVVFEAVQPVVATPLEIWINRGVGRHVVAKRLNGHDSLLTGRILTLMRYAAERHLGKKYDIYFGWSDELLYCSELVWKVYSEGAGIELAEPRPLREYDLSHPVVKAKMNERYGADAPLDEPMVAPVDIMKSGLLHTVYVAGSKPDESISEE